MPFPSWRTLSLLGLTLTAPALAAGPFYEGDDPPFDKAAALDETSLTNTLKAQLQSRGVTTVKNTDTGATGTDGLSRELKIALLLGVTSAPGAENDLMIELKGTFTPVEVIVDGASLSYRVGTPRTKLYGEGPSKEALQKKYGIGELKDDGVAWDSDTLFIVDQALSKLTPDELAAVAGVPFHRMEKDPANKAVRGRSVAMYRQDNINPPRIELYSYAVDADRRKFVGSATAPTPQSVAMLLHETAHAIARRAVRGLAESVKTARAELETASAAFNEGQKKFNADRDTWNQTKDPELGKSLDARTAAAKDDVAKVKAIQKKWSDLQSLAQRELTSAAPLERGLLAKLPLPSSPTAYGRTAVGESFAECFRLWKLDRAALDRAAPAAGAYFDSPDFARGVTAPLAP